MSKKYPKQARAKLAKKVPVIMQMDALECGAVSLSMIMAYYGLWKPVEEVRSDCDVSRNGSNAKNIIRAAREYGFDAKGYMVDPITLKDKGKFPCIIHWNFNHFVVLNGFKGGFVYINDPSKGSMKIEMQEFNQAFTGVCLVLEPSESFETQGSPKSVLDFAKQSLKGTGTAFALVFLSAAIIAIIGVIQPAFVRVLIDRLLTHENPDWLNVFVVALILITVVQVIMAWVEAVYLLKIQGKFAVVANSRFVWHILRLPIDFFSQRMAGDIAERQVSNEGIANSLINAFAPLLIDFSLMIFFLIIMLQYSVVLTIIGVVSILINVLLSRFISIKRINITRVQLRDVSNLNSATVSGVEMIESIKSSGMETGFFKKWAGLQACVNNGKVNYTKINQFYGTITTAISSLTGVAILGVGAMLIIQEDFTIGMLVAFQAFLKAFVTPTTTLIETTQSIQEMKSNIERVEDVMNFNTDVASTIEELNPEVSYDKLTGKIEIKDLTFGYSKLTKPLIKKFNLMLKTGDRVAIVGGSGSGKSTIVKLISGLYKPWRGEILFDGKPIEKINRVVFTSSLAVVDQEITLFEDSIASNIKMWDESIEDFEMILASRDAQIHQDIMQRDGGYNYIMSENGKDFSGGQKQRIEIARILAQDPTIVIFDEATSALDAKTEFDVVNAIADRGITCIVVAHRLSTIRDCDEIIVLEQGEIVERGTHCELMELNGTYSKLVISE